MNSVNITGRITHDLELRVTNSNRHVLEFQIAVRKNKDESIFMRVQAWDSTADYINNYAMKGSLLAITGRIDCQKYINKEGKNAETWLIVTNNTEVMDRKKGEQTSFNKIDADNDLPYY